MEVGVRCCQPACCSAVTGLCGPVLSLAGPIGAWFAPVGCRYGGGGCSLPRDRGPAPPVFGVLFFFFLLARVGVLSETSRMTP